MQDGRRPQSESPALRRESVMNPRLEARGVGGISRPSAFAVFKLPRDGSVVSSFHCMNDPQSEGHMASHIGRRKFLATLGGVAAGGARAAAHARAAHRRAYERGCGRYGTT